MGTDSKIEWCKHTFNPVWGCMKVSPGCKNCYAETLSKRFGKNIWGPNSGRRTFGKKHWNDPERWNRAAFKAGTRARVFCGSMCDIFEDHPVTNEARLRVFDMIERFLRLDWLLLTKRIENAEAMLAEKFGSPLKLPKNLWLGTSIEDQQRADKRVPLLLKIPAAVRFLSVEPLLGPVILDPDWFFETGPGHLDYTGFGGQKQRIWDQTLHWVIVGGESGPGARSMDLEWAQTIVDTCREYHSRPFVKQLGSVWAKQNGASHPKGGDMAEWPAALQIRKIPGEDPMIHPGAGTQNTFAY